MTTHEDATVGSADFIGHDAAGKHLLLKVPDYEDSNSSSTSRTENCAPTCRNGR